MAALSGSEAAVCPFPDRAAVAVGFIKVDDPRSRSRSTRQAQNEHHRSIGCRALARRMALASGYPILMWIACAESTAMVGIVLLLQHAEDHPPTAASQHELRGSRGRGGRRGTSIAV